MEAEAEMEAEANVKEVDDVVRELLLVRQFRPPVGKFTVEFPAGLIEKGESSI